MSGPASIRFLDVHKAFARPVLAGLTVEVPSEGITFVVGESGGGKSVMLRLAAGLLPQDRGEVWLLEHDLRRLPEREKNRLRRRVPYVVQGPALLDWRTALENVALACGGDRDRALLALERVGEAAHAGALPASLGPGTRKRIALARAIASEPKFILLDEPTTGLSRPAADQVIEAITALHVGALVVSHDFRALKALADRVLWIHEGKAAFFGPKDEFLESPRAEVQALVAPGLLEASFHG